MFPPFFPPGAAGYRPAPPLDFPLSELDSRHRSLEANPGGKEKGGHKYAQVIICFCGFCRKARIRFASRYYFFFFNSPEKGERGSPH